MSVASNHLCPINTDAVRTLNERTDDNGDRLDRLWARSATELQLRPCDWYMPSIGNDKALAMQNLKLIGKRILKTANRSFKYR